MVFRADGVGFSQGLFLVQDHLVFKENEAVKASLLISRIRGDIVEINTIMVANVVIEGL